MRRAGTTIVRRALIRLMGHLKGMKGIIILIYFVIINLKRIDEEWDEVDIRLVVAYLALPLNGFPVPRIKVRRKGLKRNEKRG